MPSPTPTLEQQHEATTLEQPQLARPTLEQHEQQHAATTLEQLQPATPTLEPQHAATTLEQPQPATLQPGPGATRAQQPQSLLIGKRRGPRGRRGGGQSRPPWTRRPLPRRCQSQMSWCRSRQLCRLK